MDHVGEFAALLRCDGHNDKGTLRSKEVFVREGQILGCGSKHSSASEYRRRIGHKFVLFGNDMLKLREHRWIFYFPRYMKGRFVSPHRAGFCTAFHILSLVGEVCI